MHSTTRLFPQASPILWMDSESVALSATGLLDSGISINNRDSVDAGISPRVGIGRVVIRSSAKHSRETVINVLLRNAFVKDSLTTARCRLSPQADTVRLWTDWG